MPLFAAQVNFEIDEAKVGAPEEYIQGPGELDPDEEFVVGPKASHSQDELVGGQGGINFNLLVGLVKKSSNPIFRLPQNNIPSPSHSSDDEKVQKDENYRSLRPGMA